MKKLFKFGLHGLGDHVMFSCVLHHLKYYFLGQRNYVLTTWGKHEVLRGIADGVYLEDDPPLEPVRFDSIEMVDWPECYKVYSDFPSTKAVAYIHDRLHVEPIKELLRYRLPSGLGLDNALTYTNYATIHYEGRTNPAAKNLDRFVVDDIANRLASLGLLEIANKDSSVSELVSDLRQSRVNICIDSGPQKIALALADSGGPPCVAVWTGHHPIHYCDYADNTIHVIPVNHPIKVRGDWSVCKDFFEANYRYMVYSNVRELVGTIGKAVKELLHG